MLKEDSNKIHILESKISTLEKKIIKLEKIILTNNLNKEDYTDNNIDNNIDNDFIESYNINDEINLDNLLIDTCFKSSLIEPKLVRQYAFDNKLD